MGFQLTLSFDLFLHALRVDALRSREHSHNSGIALVWYHQTQSLGLDRYWCFVLRMGSRGTYESRIHLVIVCISMALRGAFCFSTLLFL